MMKKVRKDRVMMVAAIVIAVIAIIAIIIINPFEKTEEIEEPTIVALPSTTYSNMEVTNVEMEYLKENNETMVSMIINNTTQNTVVEDAFDAIWVNEDGQVIGQIETYIDKLEPGKQCSISVVLKGDLRATTAIKLQEK